MNTQIYVINNSRYSVMTNGPSGLLGLRPDQTYPISMNGFAKTKGATQHQTNVSNRLSDGNFVTCVG